MSSVVKSIKKGLSSAVSTTKGALKGDFNDMWDVVTLGSKSRFDWAVDKTMDGVRSIMPDMPDVNIPEQPTSAATPGSIGRTTPNVDLGATEQQRRTGGSAKGSRKLRIPLGGLR
jgi:hypothetical protein